MPRPPPPSYRASSLPRILKCPASAAVPDIDIDEAGEGAALGRAVHAVMADIVRQELDALPDLTPYAARESVDADNIRRLAWVGLDAWRKLRPAVARVIGVEVPLEYEWRGYIITGHADVLIETTEGALAVWDWKSGWAETDCEDQLTGYLWLAARMMMMMVLDGKPPEDYKALVVWLRSREVDTRDMNLTELAVWEDNLALALEGPLTKYAPGERCFYCPRRNECPARRELVRAATADLQAATVKGASPLALSRERLVELRPRVKLLKQALERYDAATRSTIEDGGPLDLGDGRELALEDRKRRKILFARGQNVIRDLLGGHDPLKELGDAVEIGKTALLDTVAKRTPRGKKGGSREAAMKALAEAGAVKETRYKQVVARKREGGK